MAPHNQPEHRPVGDRHRYRRPKGDEQVVEHHGEDLLRMDACLSETLDASVLNLVKTPEGTGIGLTSPVDGPLTAGS